MYTHARMHMWVLLRGAPALKNSRGGAESWAGLCGEQSGTRIISSRAVPARRNPTPLPISTSGSTATPPPSFALAPAPNNTNTITSTCTGTTSSTNTRSNKHTSTNTGNSTGTDTSTNNSNSTTIPSIHVYAWDRFPLGIDCPHLFSLSVRVECPFLSSCVGWNALSVGWNAHSLGWNALLVGWNALVCRRVERLLFRGGRPLFACNGRNSEPRTAMRKPGSGYE